MTALWINVVRDALVISAIATGLALGVNHLRSSGSIALVTDKPYEILVPCPEHVGKPARRIAPEQVIGGERGVALIDARSGQAYAAWHLPGAISIPYDYLEPNPEEKRVLETRARKVVVYGDGESPDSGEQLAQAISGKGVKNVFFVAGGAPALQQARGRGRGR